MQALYDRLAAVLDGMALSAWEIVFVDDDSRDGTIAACEALAAKGLPVRLVVRKDRFAGLSGAVLRGIAESRGALLVVMDADLQHPPELLPQFLAKWREGYDVIVAVRNARVGQSLKHRMFARMFYWIFDHLSEVKLPREVVPQDNAAPRREAFAVGPDGQPR